MLSRQHRLSSSESIRRVLRRGSRVAFPWGVVIVAPGIGPQSRWAFIVSKAIGNAVMRNLVKRRFRAAAQSVRGLASEVDVVIRATPFAVDATVQEIREGVSRAITQVMSSQ